LIHTHIYIIYIYILCWITKGYLFHVLFFPTPPPPTRLATKGHGAPFRRPTPTIRGRPGCFQDPEPSKLGTRPEDNDRMGQRMEKGNTHSVCEAHLWVNDVLRTNKTNMSSFKYI
jgi:hypothetical protein